MPIKVTDFKDLPQSDSVQPKTTFAIMPTSLLATAGTSVRHTTDATPFSSLAYDWAICNTPFVSWAIYLTATIGVTLEISVTYDRDGVAFSVWRPFPIYSGRPNIMNNLFIPGFKARFTLWNSNGAAVNVNGYIQARSM